MRRETRQALVTAAVVAVALLALFAAGWRPVGPPDLPVQAHAATREVGERGVGANPVYAHGEFDAHGSRYAWDVIGPPEARHAPQAWVVQVHRIGGDGGRVWPESLAILGGAGVGGGAVDFRGDRTQEPSVVGGTVIEGWTVVLLPEGEHDVTATLTLRTYRETPLGLFRGDALAVELAFPVAVRDV